MTRPRASKEIRELRKLYFGVPIELRSMFRKWMVAECREISAAAPRYWRH